MGSFMQRSKAWKPSWPFFVNYAGNRPGFESGISLVTEDDDGSEEFNGRWQKVVEADVLVDHRLGMANGGTT